MTKKQLEEIVKKMLWACFQNRYRVDRLTVGMTTEEKTQLNTLMKELFLSQPEALGAEEKGVMDRLVQTMEESND